MWYCWWTKSCTTWDGSNPINNGINHHPWWCRILSINSIFLLKITIRWFFQLQGSSCDLLTGKVNTRGNPLPPWLDRTKAHHLVEIGLESRDSTWGLDKPIFVENVFCIFFGDCHAIWYEWNIQSLSGYIYVYIIDIYVYIIYICPHIFTNTYVYAIWNERVAEIII